ncbi:MAG: hypothetical protein ACR2PG_09980 [Hyphomicrobiaceae bacterium]
MTELILSLPEWLGICVAMLLATAVGITVYLVSHRLISIHQDGDIKDPTSSLFRVVGMLVSLMLSLAFAEVVVQLNTIKNALQREAIAISDTYSHLRLFDLERTREIRTSLLDYTKAIFEDDWPALAEDKLGQRTEALQQRFLSQILDLQPRTDHQKRVMSWIEQDVDVINDARLQRLNGALAQPPVYIYVIIFGFFVTMACFGAYRPQRPLIILASFYTSFVGLVLYLILALSDPFQGGFGVAPDTFVQLLENLQLSKEL